MPSGDAFVIQNLSRLEVEALPRFFRHARFQSLVRQLNFYNFRKINRERNFWVYQHPLFHRDRPQDLYKLKRRSVLPPGGNAAGGGKQPIKRCPSDDGYFVGKDINFDASQLSDDAMEAESTEAISSGEGKRNYPCSIKSATSENFNPSLYSFSPKAEAPDSFLQAGAHQFLGNIAKEISAQEILDFEKSLKFFDVAERTQLFSQVAEKLQDYGQLNLSDGPSISKSKSLQANNKQQKLQMAAPVTPPTSSTLGMDATMIRGDQLTCPDSSHNSADNETTIDSNKGNPKFNMLSSVEGRHVDDEVLHPLESSLNDHTNKPHHFKVIPIIQDLSGGCLISGHAVNSSTNLTSNVTTTLTSSLNDPVMVAVVHQKILCSTIYENQDEANTSAAICRLLMSTDPRDSDLGGKVSLLLSKYSVVEREFKRYCVALFPHIYPPTYSKSTASQSNQPVFLGKVRERVSRCGHEEFDRIFTSFALTWMEGLLRCAFKSTAITLDEKEKAALKQSAETWFGSVISSH